MGRKTDALRLLLLAYEPKSAMVFCNTKRTVDELTEALCDKGIQAAGLHGDMKQMQRTQVMNAFKSGRIGVLVATDVAARGIDVNPPHRQNRQSRQIRHRPDPGQRQATGVRPAGYCKVYQSGNHPEGTAHPGGSCSKENPAAA